MERVTYQCLMCPQVIPVQRLLEKKDFTFTALLESPSQRWGFSLSNNLQTPCAFKPPWVHSPLLSSGL